MTYFPIGSMTPIETNISEFRCLIDSKGIIVYVVACEFNQIHTIVPSNEILTTSNCDVAYNFIEQFIENKDFSHLHVQEYESFSDAFEVVLDMLENDELHSNKPTYTKN